MLHDRVKFDIFPVIFPVAIIELLQVTRPRTTKHLLTNTKRGRGEEREEGGRGEGREGREAVVVAGAWLLVSSGQFRLIQPATTIENGRVSGASSRKK